MWEHLLRFRFFYYTLAFFSFFFFFVFVCENIIIFWEQKDLIKIIILSDFTQEDFVKEIKKMRVIIRDPSNILGWNSPIEHSEIRRTELPYKGITLDPLKSYFKYDAFSSYSEFIEYWKEKYSFGSKNKLSKLKNIATCYGYNYKDKYLEIYDLYVFEDKLIIIKADNNDKKYLMESEEAIRIKRIFINKEEFFLDALLGDNKKTLFIAKNEDKELSLRIKLLYNKIDN